MLERRRKTTPGGKKANNRRYVVVFHVFALINAPCARDNESRIGGSRLLNSASTASRLINTDRFAPSKVMPDVSDGGSETLRPDFPTMMNLFERIIEEFR